MVVRLHGAWRAAAWAEIKTEALVEENKELLKQLRRQGNEQQVRLQLCPPHVTAGLSVSGWSGRLSGWMEDAYLPP